MADHRAGKADERLASVGAAFPAHAQPFEAVQPCEGPLDVPAVFAEPGAVSGAAAGDVWGDVWGDAALARHSAVLVVIVAAVGVEAVGSPCRTADDTADRWYPVEEWDELGDVVAVP